MEFIKTLKNNEKIVYGVRTLSPISTKIEGMELVINASSMAYSEPKENVELENYTSMQVEFSFNGENVTVDTVNELLGESKIDSSIDSYLVVDDIFSPNVYANVPVGDIENIFNILTKETDKETDSISLENEVEKVEKVEEKAPATPTKKKRKITQKQAIKIINDIMIALSQKFFEMEEEIRSLMLGLLSKEHILMVGLPGIAKSDLSRQLGKITGGQHFGIQFQQTTTPDEVFGGIDHEQYIQGHVVRNTNGTLVNANFAYLDEIFKANSAILNHLLQVLNERTYDNGGKIEVPLISAVGASNEFPDEDELSALYDRFLIRHYVLPVKDKDNYVKMLKGEGKDVKIPHIDLEDVFTMHDMVENVQVDDEIYESVFELVTKVADEGIYISPRRAKKSIKVLKANAFIEGRNQVKKEDLIVLKNIFWSDYDQKDVVTKIVDESVCHITEIKLKQFRNEAIEIFNNFKGLAPSEKRSGAMEYGSKLKNINLDVQSLLAQNEDSEFQSQVHQLIDEIKDMNKEIFEEGLAKI